MLTVKVFLGKVSHPKIEYFPNWVKLSITVYCSILITILKLFFSKFLSFIVGAKLFPKLDFLQINKNLVKGYIDMCWLQIWHLQFQLLFRSIFFFFFFFGKFDPKIWFYLYWLEFSAGLHCSRLITIGMLFKIFVIQFSGSIIADYTLIVIIYNP